MEPHDLLATLAALGHPRLLVLGDLILDRYTCGDAERISQEAPVIVLRADAARSPARRRRQRLPHAARARGGSRLRRRRRR